MKVTVILVRNAEHLGDVARPPFWAGKKVGLTPRGKRQAVSLCELLASVDINAIFSSDYVRAVQTIMPLSERLGLAIKKERTFDPLQLGKVFGCTIEETVQALGAETWKEIVTAPHPRRRYFEGGETLQEQAQRAWKGLQHLAIGQGRSSTVVVSTHQTVIGCILCRIVGAPLKNLWAWGGSMAKDYATYSVVELSDGNWSLQHFNFAKNLA